MRIKTFGSVIALSSAGIVAVTACGDDTTVRTTEPCEAGLNECVSEQVGRACPEGPEPGWVYFACSDNEVCEMGNCVFDTESSDRLGLCTAETKECVSDALARQCAKGGDAWLPLACASGTVCHEGDCVPAGSVDGGSGGVQVCSPGAIECATEYAVKTCQNDGSEWVVTLCQAGELCQDGACVQNRDSACIPNTSQCLDETSGLRCREDGQGYDEFTCPAEAPCDGFKCMGEVCTPGETKCADPVDAAGLGGGPLVVQGHIFANPDVYQCNATGDGWDVIPCAVDEMCVYNSLTPSESAGYEDLYIQYLQELSAAKDADTALPAPPVFIHPPNRFQEASCILPDCYQALGALGGTTVCGDPADEAVDPQSFYSVCQGLAPFSTPQWVPYTCQAPEMCDPNNMYYGDPCSTDCIPGEVVCGAYFGGDNDSVYGCNAQGEWEEQQSCNPGVDKALTCYQLYPEDGSGELRTAQCVDPLCAHIWDYAEYNAGYETVYGFCEGDQIRTCDENGRVVPAAEAMDCGSGRCYDSGLRYEDIYDSYYGSRYYGFTFGWCEEECTDGETRCVDTYSTNIDYYGWGMADSPFFMTCVGGVWDRTAYQACPGTNPGETETCYQIWQYAQENETISDVVCGGECQPGHRQCTVDSENPQNNNTGIQTCGPDGFWGAPDLCDVGSCINEHPWQWQAFWDAECVFDCVPGTYYGTQEFLADAGSNYYNEVQCGDDGRWQDPNRCDGPSNQFFVDSYAGCVECYGPELAAYWSSQNGWEVKVESTCDIDGNILWCGADNRWPEEGQSCGQGNTCWVFNAGGNQYMSDEIAYCGEALPPPPVVDAGGDGGDGGQQL